MQRHLVLSLLSWPVYLAQHPSSSYRWQSVNLREISWSNCGCGPGEPVAVVGFGRQVGVAEPFRGFRGPFLWLLRPKMPDVVWAFPKSCDESYGVFNVFVAITVREEVKVAVKVAIKIAEVAIFLMLNIKLLLQFSPINLLNIKLSLKKTLIKRTKTLRNGPMNNWFLILSALAIYLDAAACVIVICLVVWRPACSSVVVFRGGKMLINGRFMLMFHHNVACSAK